MFVLFVELVANITQTNCIIVQGGARCPLCRSPSPDPLLMDSTETTLSGAVDSTGGSKQGLQLWVIALVASILVVLVVVLGGYIVWQQRRSSKAQSKSDHSTKASRVRYCLQLACSLIRICCCRTIALHTCRR